MRHPAPSSGKVNVNRFFFSFIIICQVGDQIVEINGEATQGITHTRAIELIQAGGNKVHLLLRPGQGLVPDHSELLQSTARMLSPLHIDLLNSLLVIHIEKLLYGYAR